MVYWQCVPFSRLYAFEFPDFEEIVYIVSLIMGPLHEKMINWISLMQTVTSDDLSYVGMGRE